MNARRDFLTGLFLIAAGALLLGAYLYSSLAHFTRNARLYIVEAPEISGISEGTEVAMGGYKLGTVRKVTVITRPRLSFELEIAIRRDVPIPRGTRVVIATRSLGGARVLQLVLPARSVEELPEGSRLSAEPQADLQQVLTLAQKAMTDFAGVASDLRKFTSDDAAHEGLAKILKRLDKTLADTDLVVLAAGKFVRRLDETAGALRPKLDSSMAHLDGTLANSERATGRLDELLKNEGPEVHKILVLAQQRLDDMKVLSTVLAQYDPKQNPELRGLLIHLEGASRNLEALLGELRKRPWLLIRKGQELPGDPGPAPASAPASAPRANSPASAPGDR